MKVARFQWVAAVSLLGLAWLGSTGWTLTRAEEIQVEARLVWGTNDETSKNPAHKPVDKDTAERLQKVFKWKNYFLETRLVETIPSRQTRKLKLSQACSVEITEMPGASVEVVLYGHGKPVSKTTESLHHGGWIVIGGDDRNQCAWFVILNRRK